MTTPGLLRPPPAASSPTGHSLTVLCLGARPGGMPGRRWSTAARSWRLAEPPGRRTGEEEHLRAENNPRAAFPEQFEERPWHGPWRNSRAKCEFSSTWPVGAAGQHSLWEPGVPSLPRGEKSGLNRHHVQPRTPGLMPGQPPPAPGIRHGGRG